jgi:hypothetical protein
MVEEGVERREGVDDLAEVGATAAADVVADVVEDELDGVLDDDLEGKNGTVGQLEAVDLSRG